MTTAKVPFAVLCGGCLGLVVGRPVGDALEGEGRGAGRLGPLQSPHHLCLKLSHNNTFHVFLNKKK